MNGKQARSILLELSLLHSPLHFRAPTFKWGISIANIVHFTKPPGKLSYPQQIGMYMNSYIFLILTICCAAVTFTGIIWSRYSIDLFEINLWLRCATLFKNRIVFDWYFRECILPIE
ncbi:mitochondrial pyruvate carrier 4 isoform X1 [Fagus crenata]